MDYGAPEKPRLEIMSRDACIAQLEKVTVGRIGITSGALPVILPVNFAVFDQALYFRTVPGTKLDAATAKAVVAFQTDAYAPDGSAGWSVLVQGQCRRVQGAGEMAKAMDFNLVAWPLEPEALHTVRLDIGTISGRQFGDLTNPWLGLH